jgi:hypothetical protein
VCVFHTTLVFVRRYAHSMYCTLHGIPNQLKTAARDENKMNWRRPSLPATARRCAQYIDCSCLHRCRPPKPYHFYSYPSYSQIIGLVVTSLRGTAFANGCQRWFRYKVRSHSETLHFLLFVMDFTYYLVVLLFSFCLNFH